MDSEGRVLKGYNDELKVYIEENKNNVIIKTEEELSAYIDEAFTNKLLKGTLYLGSIPQDIMTDIKNNIQNISDRDREKLLKKGEYSLTIHQDDIRHLLKDGMTIGDVKHYIANLTRVIIGADRIIYSVYRNVAGNRNVLRFEKEFEDGKYIAVEMISNKKRTLSMKSIFMDKQSYKKKKSISRANDKTSAYTSKTRGASTSNNSIFNNSEKSNTKKSVSSDNDLRHSMRAVSAEDYESVIQENEELKAQVGLLERQFEVTKGHAPNMEDVQNMGRKFLKKLNNTPFLPYRIAKQSKVLK